MMAQSVVGDVGQPYPNREARRAEKHARHIGTVTAVTPAIQAEQRRQACEQEEHAHAQAQEELRAARRLRREDLDSLNISGLSQASFFQMHEHKLLDALGVPQIKSAFLAYLEKHDTLRDYDRDLVQWAEEWLYATFPAYHRAVVACYFRRNSYREAALVLGVSHQTVMTHKRQGLAWMRSWCGDQVQAARNAGLPAPGATPPSRVVLVQEDVAARHCDQCGESIPPAYKTLFAFGWFCSVRCSRAFAAAMD